MLWGLCSIRVFFFTLFSSRIFFLIIFIKTRDFQWCKCWKPGFIALQWTRIKDWAVFWFYNLLIHLLLIKLADRLSLIIAANVFFRRNQPTRQKCFAYLLVIRFIIVNEYHLSVDYFCYVLRTKTASETNCWNICSEGGLCWRGPICSYINIQKGFLENRFLFDS